MSKTKTLNGKLKRKCNRGYSCGNGCISRKLRCTKNLDSAGKALKEDYASFVNRITGSNISTNKKEKSDIVLSYPDLEQTADIFQGTLISNTDSGTFPGTEQEFINSEALSAAIDDINNSQNLESKVVSLMTAKSILPTVPQDETTEALNRELDVVLDDLQNQAPVRFNAAIGAAEQELESINETPAPVENSSPTPNNSPTTDIDSPDFDIDDFFADFETGTPTDSLASIPTEAPVIQPAEPTPAQNPMRRADFISQSGPESAKRARQVHSSVSGESSSQIALGENIAERVGSELSSPPVRQATGAAFNAAKNVVNIDALDGFDLANLRQNMRGASAIDSVYNQVGKMALQQSPDLVAQFEVEGSKLLFDQAFKFLQDPESIQRLADTFPEEYNRLMSILLD